MTTKYITTKTATLFDKPTGKSSSLPPLIYGDEVIVDAPAAAGRTRASFRGKDGYIETKSLGETPALELYFIDVGTGDSAFIVTPNRKKILVDGGLNNRARGFLAWKYRLDQPDTFVDIDLLVLTHADGDHIQGLIPIIQHPRINVKRIIHSGIATYANNAFDTELGDRTTDGKYLVTRHSTLGDLGVAKLSPTFADWRQAIKDKGTPIQYEAVGLGTGMIDIGDPTIALEVLGPRLENVEDKPAYRWFDDKSHTINGHSVVLRLTHQDVRALFAGDLNDQSEDYLMGAPGMLSKFSAHVFKAPHHGSQEFSPAFLKAVRPQVSVISSGDDRDYGHPRACFIGAVGQTSRSEQPLVFSTEIAANFVEATAKDTAEAAAPPDSDAQHRHLFKRRLHGMINVRSDGAHLYAARRIAGTPPWEAYGPIPVAP